MQLPWPGWQTETFMQKKQMTPKCHVTLHGARPLYFTLGQLRTLTPSWSRDLCLYTLTYFALRDVPFCLFVFCEFFCSLGLFCFVLWQPLIHLWLPILSFCGSPINYVICYKPSLVWRFLEEMSGSINILSFTLTQDLIYSLFPLFKNIYYITHREL